MNKLNVRIVNKSNNKLPSYSTLSSAGMDVRAFLSENIILKSMDRIIIPTGLYIELPVGFEAQIRPRSGLAIKHGISILNSPGTIDADYRGEIGIIIANLSKDDFEIKNGDRICQMVVASHETVEWELTDDLSKTQRGAGGFGHTGKS